MIIDTPSTYKRPRKTTLQNRSVPINPSPSLPQSPWAVSAIKNRKISLIHKDIALIFKVLFHNLIAVAPQLQRQFLDSL